ncbi:MAG: ECF transporter S component [Clostridiales bacterium]|nr:ECF transporter S component [Clostridiales bacterium]
MFDTKCIATAGVCVALSFALSYVKIFELPYGGSITLFSMFPVMLFAYVYGIKKGLVVGLLYGMLQAIQDPFIVHPAQFLLDYPIAFAMLGFAGCLSGFNFLKDKPRLKFTLSAAIAGVLRWVCHVFSGVFAFGAYALDAIDKSEGIFSVLAPAATPTANFWLYSTIYNGYVFVDLILVIAVGLALFSSKGFTRQVEMLNPEA